MIKLLKKICLALAIIFAASISEVAFADVAPHPGEIYKRPQRQSAANVDVQIKNIDVKKNRLQVLISRKADEDANNCTCQIIQSNGSEVKNYSGEFDKNGEVSFKCKYEGLAEDYPRNLIIEVKTSSDKVKTRYGTKTTQNPVEKSSRFTVRFMRDRDGNLTAKVSERYSSPVRVS